MTNTQSSTGSQAQDYLELPKDPTRIDAAIGQTIDISDVTIPETPLSTGRIEDERQSIRQRILAKLAAKRKAADDEAEKARLAQASEQQKAPIGIDLTDENRNVILSRVLESTQRTNASGGLGTLEDRIATHIGMYLMKNNEPFRDDVYADTKESLERYLSPGETWDDETFYKIWNEIAAVAETED